MATPNEYTSSLMFPQPGVSPMINQPANSFQNFLSMNNMPMNDDQFNRNSFQPNCSDYNEVMLPSMADTSFDSAFCDNMSNMKRSENPVTNNQANLFGVQSVQNEIQSQNMSSMYWPNQPQLNPFGILNDLLQNINDNSKTSYNSSINDLYSTDQQPLGNLDALPNTCNKQSMVMASGKQKESLSKVHTMQYIPGHSTGMKNNSFHNDDVSFFNNSNYKMGNSVVTSGHGSAVSTDYQIFKPNSFPNNSNLVAETYQQNSLPAMSNHRRGTMDSQMLPQTNQPSPATIPTTINEHYSPSLGLPHIDVSEISNHSFMFENPSISTVPDYRSLPDTIFSNDNANKISSPFAKIQYQSQVNALNTSITSNPYSMSPKSPLDQFVSYNNSVHSPNQVVQNPVTCENQVLNRIKKSDIVGQSNCSSSVSMNNSMNTSTMNAESIQSNSLTFSDIFIPAANGNFNMGDGMNKPVQQIPWKGIRNPISRPVTAASPSQPVNTNTHQSMDLDNRQYSYFNTSISSPQPNSNSTTNNTPQNNILRSNISNQYSSISANMTTVPVTQSQSTFNKTSTRKRKNSKISQNPISNTSGNFQTNNANKHAMVNSLGSVNSNFPNVTPSSPLVDMYRQQFSSPDFSEESAPPPTPNEILANNSECELANISDCLNSCIDDSTFRKSTPNSNEIFEDIECNQISSLLVNNIETSREERITVSARNSPPNYSAEPIKTPSYEKPVDSIGVDAENTGSSECMIVDSETSRNRGEVIVPDIEEEFKFLFDPNLPNYELISSNDEEELSKDRASKPVSSRQNIDFLSSYKRFLESNRENVEKSREDDSATFKSSSHSKNSKSLPKEAYLEKATKERTPSIEKTDVYDFDDDLRYYPFPKSTTDRKVWISSSDDEANDKMQNLKSTSSVKKSKVMRGKHSSDKKVVREKKTKKVIHGKEVETGDQNYKYKKESLFANTSTSENKCISDAEITYKSVPRRKVSERKAKSNIEDKIRSSLNLEDDSPSSSDSDPSWTPQEDDGNSAKRKNHRNRFVRGGSSYQKYFEGDERSYDGRGRKPNCIQDFVNDSFLIPKNCANLKNLELLRLKDKKLQRFEETGKDRKRLFSSTYEFKKLNEVDLNKYQEARINIIEDGPNRVVVELCDDIVTTADLETRENFMKDSMQYKSQFSVYIQSLVSQALDCNFFREIVKENDLYFLNNMKIIDGETAKYLSELDTVMKWKDSPVTLQVKTWPFLLLKNIRIKNVNNDEECKSCGRNSVMQTAIFYGQPYERETLVGLKSNSNIPNNLDKTVNLCNGCAKIIKLFNMIWHQKYHVFVECAKYVAKKKTESKERKATDILKELLADSNWLSKLFYDFRNTWLQIRMTVNRRKGS